MLPQGPESPRTTPRHWTVGRIATWLAIVAVAVPSGLRFLDPPIPGECATTGDNAIMALGLMFLGARLAWIPLKALNDAFERGMAAREARDRLSTKLPGPPSTP